MKLSEDAKMKLSEVDCRKVCYANLIGHCKHHSSKCATEHARYIRNLSDMDKLVLHGIMGEQEEFDDGTEANEMLHDYLIGRVKVTIEWFECKTADGKQHCEHLIGARYNGN